MQASKLTTTELIEKLATLICLNDHQRFNKVIWGDLSACITNGHIAIAFTDAAYKDGYAHNEDLAKSIKDAVKCERAIAFTAPEIEPHSSWMDPNATILAQCDTCWGTGVVTCEYDHEHDCPDCDGDGESCHQVIEKYLSLSFKKRHIKTPFGWFDRRYLWIIFEIAKHRELTFVAKEFNGGVLLGFKFNDGFGGVMSVLKREDA